MNHNEKRDWAIVGVILILLLVWWLWNKREAAKAAQPMTSGDLPMPGATQYWGSNGQPFAQGGTMNNPILNNINIPVPEYGYSGNSQIYMPMFGFVGYSSVGTV